jgi:hypothetical protein
MLVVLGIPLQRLVNRVYKILAPKRLRQELHDRFRGGAQLA